MSSQKLNCFDGFFSIAFFPTPTSSKMINQECCVCYSTNKDIAARYTDSFITIPCDGKHVVCFKCFIKNENKKCPMCRYEYTLLEEEEEPQIEEEHQEYHEINYEYHRYIRGEFENHQEVLEKASRVWREFYTTYNVIFLTDSIKDVFAEKKITNTDSLYSQTFDNIVSKVNSAYNDQMPYCFREYNGDIMSAFDSEYEVCRIVYISKIIEELVAGRSIVSATNEFVDYETRVEEDLDNL